MSLRPLIPEPWPGARPGLSEPALMKIREQVYPVLNTGFNQGEATSKRRGLKGAWQSRVLRSDPTTIGGVF